MTDADQLQEQVHPTEVEVHVDALGSIKVSERLEAVAALTAGEDSALAHHVIQPLAGVLKTDSNANVRAFVAERICRLGDLAMDPLIEVLTNRTEEDFIRIKAARSLGHFRSADSQDCLLAELTNSGNDLRVRHAAIEAIADLSTKESILALASSVAAIENDALRARAVTLLGESEFGYVVREPIADVLNPRCGPKTAKAAATAFRRVAGRDAIRPLATLASQADDAAVRGRAVDELGQLHDPEAEPWLVRSLLMDTDRSVRLKAARAISGGPPTEEVVRHLLEVGDTERLSPRAVERDLLEEALAVPMSGGFQDGTTPIDLLIDEASRRIQPSPYLAALLLALSGDSDKAGDAVNAFAAKKVASDPASLQWLRIELGGYKALDPILDQLRGDLHMFFQIPVHKLNEETRAQWERTLSDARLGFRIRMFMSIAVFVVGLALVVASSWQSLFGPFDSIAVWGTGVSFVSGLGSMFAVVYSGPLRDIRTAMRDLAASNAVFIAYIHRVLQVSHTFSALYLREQMTLEAAERASKIVKLAMEDSIKALSLDPFPDGHKGAPREGSR